MAKESPLAVPQGGEPSLAADLSEIVTSGAATAAAVLYGSAGSEPVAAWAGWSRVPGSEGGAGHALTASALFDVASLTKPVSASVALRWHERGVLALGTTLGELWGGAAAPELAERTMEDLLRHRTGFRRWAPLYTVCGARSDVSGALLSAEMVTERRPGYSDLDYILWGLSAERALGEPLATLVDRELAELPLPRPLVAAPADQAVECRMDGAREATLAAEGGWPAHGSEAPAPGTVQDGNARFLGGLGGHAGLFASARAMWTVVAEWITPGGWLPGDGVEDALAGDAAGLVLGWTRPGGWPQAAQGLSEGTFGHVGFTGGSVWFDPQHRRGMVFLAHRSSPEADLGPWRRRFHERLGRAG